MVLGGPESPPQEMKSEEVSPELPRHQQLLLGSADNPDATMERLLMSMMGSLETYATAVEAGINY